MLRQDSILDDISIADDISPFVKFCLDRTLGKSIKNVERSLKYIFQPQGGFGSEVTAIKHWDETLVNVGLAQPVEGFICLDKDPVECTYDHYELVSEHRMREIIVIYLKAGVIKEKWMLDEAQCLAEKFSLNYNKKIIIGQTSRNTF